MTRLLLFLAVFCGLLFATTAQGRYVNYGPDEILDLKFEPTPTSVTQIQKATKYFSGPTTVTTYKDSAVASLEEQLYEFNAVFGCHMPSKHQVYPGNCTGGLLISPVELDLDWPGEKVKNHVGQGALWPECHARVDCRTAHDLTTGAQYRELCFSSVWEGISKPVVRRTQTVIRDRNNKIIFFEDRLSAKP